MPNDPQPHDPLDIAAGLLEDLGPSTQPSNVRRSNAKPTTNSYLKVKPFMRYMGGKQRSSKVIISRLRGATNTPWSHYAEPFVGAGAVFWQAVADGLITRETHVYLADANAACINMWNLVRTYGAGLLALVKPYADEFEANPAVFYEWVRKFNAGISDVGLIVALRWGASNGIWRVNSKGLLNSSKCDALKLPQQSAARLEACQAVLKWPNITIACVDWPYTRTPDDINWISVPCGVLYGDPPYVDSEDGYTSKGFPWSSTVEVVESAEAWAANGWLVGLSNHDRRAYRELLDTTVPDHETTVLRVGRSVSFTADKRDPVKELFTIVQPSRSR